MQYASVGVWCGIGQDPTGHRPCDHRRECGRGGPRNLSGSPRSQRSIGADSDAARRTRGELPGSECYGPGNSADIRSRRASQRRFLDLLPYVCDAAVSKQENSCQEAISPSARLRHCGRIRQTNVVILPRNIAHEVRTQLVDLVHSGVCFVTAVPELSFL